MKYAPHNYQQQATRFITTTPRCAIFLDMGLGKTIITLTALKELLYNQLEAAKILIIAPKRVAETTWPDEINKWDHTKHLTYAIAVGTPTKRTQALAANAEITIINRENIDWLVNKSGHTWDFDTVVIDELSSFKSHRATRFKALRKALPKINRIIGLTGTPSPNGLLDLWAQYRLIDGGQRLGRFIGAYRREYFQPDKRNAYQIFTYKPQPGAENRIYKQIGDITLSMRATDHLQLPELTTINTPVRLDPREETAYKRFEKLQVLELEEAGITAASAGALLGKLIQYASGAIYSDTGQTVEIHSRKLDTLEDIIEAANGKPVLVAYWFKHDQARIKTRFPHAVNITTPDTIRDWNQGRIEIGLIHPASAGHGLNLQAGGSHLVWFTTPWSLELYQQTNARLYRQGQGRPVVIQHLVTAGTVDERVLRALGEKNVTQEALFEAVKEMTQ